METLLLLICAHYVGDYGLQNDYIALNKGPGHVSWFHVMTAHCAIQAMGVILVTGVWWLGVAEFLCHFALDVSKCRMKISLNQDQIGHLICRVIWFFIWMNL